MEGAGNPESFYSTFVSVRGAEMDQAHNNTIAAPTANLLFAAAADGNMGLVEPPPANNPAGRRVKRAAPTLHLPENRILPFMRMAVPSDGGVEEEAVRTVQECVTKFIRYVTNGADEISSDLRRKRITAEDLMSALNSLGFEHYADVLSAYLNCYRQGKSAGGGGFGVRRAAAPRP